MPRRVGRSPELRAALLDALRGGLALDKAAPQVGVSYGFAFKWLKDDPELRAEYEVARAFGKATPTAVTQRRATAVAGATVRERRKRGWCDDKACGKCRSCAARRAALAGWAVGAYAGVAPRREDTWLAEHDARLRALAGTRTRAEIAAALAAEFGVPRTVRAVSERARRLGVALWMEAAVSLCEAARLLGTKDATVARLLREGALRGRRGATATRPQHWIELAELRRFVRERPWAYDYRVMADGPLRKLAETVQRADPWLTMREVGLWLHLSPARVREHIKAGRMEARWRDVGLRGGGRVVRRATLPRAAEAIAAWTAEAEARRTEAVNRARWGERAVAVA